MCTPFYLQQGAEHVIAVDGSEAMVSVAQQVRLAGVGLLQRGHRGVPMPRSGGGC